MSPPLRGGLIGCGFFAINQLHAWRDVADAEIVAICDYRSRPPAQIVGNQFNIARRYTDAQRHAGGRTARLRRYRHHGAEPPSLSSNLPRERMCR